MGSVVGYCKILILLQHLNNSHPLRVLVGLVPSISSIQIFVTPQKHFILSRFIGLLSTQGENAYDLKYWILRRARHCFHTQVSCSNLGYSISLFFKQNLLFSELHRTTLNKPLDS